MLVKNIKDRINIRNNGTEKSLVGGISINLITQAKCVRIENDYSSDGNQ